MLTSCFVLFSELSQYLVTDDNIRYCLVLLICALNVNCCAANLARNHWKKRSCISMGSSWINKGLKKKKICKMNECHYDSTRSFSFLTLIMCMCFVFGEDSVTS